MKKNKFRKLLVFILVFAWLFTGWPPVWQNPRIPPRVKEVQAAVAFNTFAISTPTTATITFTIPIPATIVADQDLYVLFVSRDHLSGTALATLTDNDTGGNTWTRIGGSTNRKLNVFWKKATSATASKTITVAGAVGSSAGGLSAFTGGASGNPTTNFVVEDNAAADETHAGFTPDVANSFIVFGVINPTNDLDITLLAAATLGALEPEQWAAESTGGSDCKSTLTGKVNSGTTATGNFTWAQTDAITSSVSFAIKPPPITTLGNGASEPSNVTIAPGGSITDLDNFTLQSDTGSTDTVTAAVVTLGPAGAFNNIAQVDITDSANTAKCTAVSGLSSNTVTFNTCNIPASTASTTYKIRITPKTHPNMPAVPGASYATTGTVTAFTCTNTQAGSDTGSATVTVDNASPGAVSGIGGTAGNQQVQLSWTNPGDSDFAGVVVLRRANIAVGGTPPTEGDTYIVGNTIDSSTVACVENSPSTSCTDTGLINNTPYHYKIFTKDSRGNYDAGTVPSGSPFTPFLVSISITTDGLVSFGYLGLGTTQNTYGLSHPETVSVDSGPATLNIKSTNFTQGANTWTLNTTNGINLVKWEFSKDGSSWTTFASPEPTSYTFDTNVAQGQTRNLYLRITMPTETVSYEAYSSTVTIVASTP